MEYTYLLIGLIISYLIGAASSIILNKKDHLCACAAFISASIASVFGIILSLSVVFGETFTFTLSSSSFLNFGFFVDRLSAFFILLISIAVFAVSIYSIGYAKEYFGKKNIGYLGFLYNIFILSMILVVTANNAVMFLIVWELMSVISYFLVVYEHEKPEVRKAGFIYIVMTHIGTGFIILSFLILASGSGSFDFETFSSTGAAMPQMLKDLVFLFALIGFGAKAGIVPLHIWLPYAHPAAPSNVSALMSGVMIKTAIYMLIRVFFDFLGAGVLWWGVLVLILASASALLGVMYALMEHDIKRLLAYHSVENIGIILIGISVSMIFVSSGYTELAAFGLIAGLYHTVNHAVFKSLLFMGAGSLIYSTHTRNMEDMGGLLKKMPWTGLFFLVGSISISALPPLNGFVSEWLTFQAQLLSINLSDNIIKIAVLSSGAALALTSALAAACFVKAFGISFLALPRSKAVEHAKEGPKSMLFGMGTLSLLCIILGVLPFYFVPVLNSIAAPLVGTTISKVTFDLSLAVFSLRSESISTMWLFLMLFIFLSLPFILALAVGGRTPTKTYDTWGCGQPVTTARNEYTATAFSKPIRMWLGNIYRPHREIQITYAGSPYFKERLTFDAQVEPIFEKYMYEPVAGLVVSVSRILRVIQTGSIHAYLAYIFITLIILFAFVISGGG
ncbi:formate hydrogenlyase subunit 3/multisubunit Na+/H+ antiporter, MnhD subunit [Candidatus Methanoperedens nitroreducens]|uniref:Formate hydrogenlyase subunit 3/multisubunit Na+/H+ antiporter, MnhD subunit n=1 Tax=Candidatus Methanoperedens nitratireducens TaxID=1392998 RepID=A0A062UUI2_9EURY|nr:hydrogenase 4 subunit B [Candidatus Methanoperedens nitroreducens]KCZ70701.1 formate hydrogenlyase subunit 3/multisubunit Na+/H+ antiporter, MnhD subunit [Candidatus Methanoperedens nitroreducens]MDJ1420555.1 hydrogenase 4 subunit B [Candidatus Methanoperedens sp.]